MCMAKRKPKNATKVRTNAKAGSCLVRIIGGEWRSRRLSFPAVDGLRPSPDRVRETLFNWLMESVYGANCLDLFCGSGVLGLEALSRGAGRLTAVDANARVVAQLLDNLATLNCDRARVLQADALQWLVSPLARQPEWSPFDLVFLDPPFRQSLLNKTVALLERRNVLADNAKVYIECEQELDLHLPGHWKKCKEQRAGQLCYRLYTVSQESALA